MTETVHPNALLIGPDGATRRTVLAVMAERGVRGRLVDDATEAEALLARQPWRLAVIDCDVVGDGALDVAARLLRRSPELPVMLLADAPETDLAVEAGRLGCRALLSKPLSADAFARRLETLTPNHEVRLAAAAAAESRSLYEIAGRSEPLRAVLDLAGRVAPTSMPVLICGESGTGKELVSALIHRASRRAAGPYERVNCAAVSESLLESELFGHEQGAFTGAGRRHEGRFERADGGTLLLDEISETGPKLQAELLRVLEEQDFERVGGSEPVSVNVRIISTTNRDLPSEIEDGRFRRDLYYRIGGVRLMVPPLRDRIEDLPELVWHFVNRYAGEVNRRIVELDPEMMRLFAACRWPGNIRQLRNAVRTALVLGEGATLSLDEAPGVLEELTGDAASSPGDLPDLSLQALERKAILEALRKTKSHQARAARLLGITDRTLREKLRRYRRDGEPVAVGECA